MHIQYSEFRASSVSQGKRELLKTPEFKKHIQYSEKFQGNSVFSGQAQVAQQSWMVKNIFHTMKNFRAHSVFQGKRKLLKNPECEKCIQ